MPITQADYTLVEGNGNQAWLLISAALVGLMTPALAIFYSSLVRENSVVSTAMLAFGTMAVVSVLYSLIGFAIAFGQNAESWGWSMGTSIVDLKNEPWERPGLSPPQSDTEVSSAGVMVYNMMFATITAAIVTGVAVQRMRYWFFLFFIACWHLLVYCPIVHATGNTSGFLAQWGVLDFAGGLYVHTSSGVSSLVLSLLLRKRKNVERSTPHNLPLVLLSTSLLYFGWFGFTGGAALAANYSAGRCALITHLGGCVGLATWNLLESVFSTDGWFKGRPTAVGAACGMVTGLVAITPAAGYIMPVACFPVAIVVTSLVFVGQRMVKNSAIDDRLDCFPIHGLGGIVGTLCVGLFASSSVSDALAPVPNGAFFGNGAQFGKQLVGVIFTVAASGLGTAGVYLFCRLVAAVLRTDMELPDDTEEKGGPDNVLHGERAYYWTVADPNVNGLEGFYDLEEDNASIISFDVGGHGRRPSLNPMGINNGGNSKDSRPQPPGYPAFGSDIPTAPGSTEAAGHMVHPMGPPRSPSGFSYPLPSASSAGGESAFAVARAASVVATASSAQQRTQKPVTLAQLPSDDVPRKQVPLSPRSPAPALASPASSGRLVDGDVAVTVEDTPGKKKQDSNGAAASSSHSLSSPISILRKNIAQRKLLQKEVAAMEQKKAAARAMTSYTLHDLRVPLQALSLGMQEIRYELSDCEHCSGKDDLQEVMSGMELASTQMERVMDLALQWEKMEAGKFTLELSAMSAQQLLNVAAMQIHKRAADENVSLIVDVDPRAAMLGEVLGDLHRLLQILLNLLSNAVKFVRKDGTGKVRLRLVISGLKATQIEGPTRPASTLPTPATAADASALGAASASAPAAAEVTGPGLSSSVLAAAPGNQASKPPLPPSYPSSWLSGLFKFGKQSKGNADAPVLPATLPAPPGITIPAAGDSFKSVAIPVDGSDAPSPSHGPSPSGPALTGWSSSSRGSVTSPPPDGLANRTQSEDSNGSGSSASASGAGGGPGGPNSMMSLHVDEGCVRNGSTLTWSFAGSQTVESLVGRGGASGKKSAASEPTTTGPVGHPPAFLPFTPAHNTTYTVSLDANEHAVANLVAMVNIAVEDNGVGIPQDQQGKLFKPWSQIKAAELQAGKGSGLGLSLCKEIVTRMGGDVYVYSAGVPGYGSTFGVTLPMRVLKRINKTTTGGNGGEGTSPSMVSFPSHEDVSISALPHGALLPAAHQHQYQRPHPLSSAAVPVSSLSTVLEGTGRDSVDSSQRSAASHSGSSATRASGGRADQDGRASASTVSSKGSSTPGLPASQGGDNGDASSAALGRVANALDAPAAVAQSALAPERASVAEQDGTRERDKWQKATVTPARARFTEEVVGETDEEEDEVMAVRAASNGSHLPYRHRHFTLPDAPSSGSISSASGAGVVGEDGSDRMSVATQDDAIVAAAAAAIGDSVGADSSDEAAGSPGGSESLISGGRAAFSSERLFFDDSSSDESRSRDDKPGAGAVLSVASNRKLRPAAPPSASPQAAAATTSSAPPLSASAMLLKMMQQKTKPGVSQPSAPAASAPGEPGNGYPSDAGSTASSRHAAPGSPSSHGAASHSSDKQAANERAAAAAAAAIAQNAGNISFVGSSTVLAATSAMPPPLPKPLALAPAPARPPLAHFTHSASPSREQALPARASPTRERGLVGVEAATGSPTSSSAAEASFSSSGESAFSSSIPAGGSRSSDPASSSAVQSTLQCALCVDDSSVNLKFLARALKRAFPGTGLLTAADGQEAVNIVKSRMEHGQPLPGFITCDREMPVMDGREAVRTLRSIGYTGLIIGVTGAALVEEKTEFLEAGADFVLAKPINFQALVDMVHQQLGAAGGDGASSAVAASV